ncbi:VOC family protein [Enterococcus sp. N249-2]
MRIEHVAIFTKDLEKMRTFYEIYFDATSGEKYHNQKTGFQSYFLTFASGSRLELTTKAHLSPRIAESFGYNHLAMAVGNKLAVDQLATQFVADGYPLLSGPRTTGDGYYEAVIQDPEGNLIELTTDTDSDSGGDIHG